MTTTRTARRCARRGLAAALAAGGAVIAAAVPAAASDTYDDVSPEQELTDAIVVVDQYWADNYAWYFGEDYVAPLVYTGSEGVQGMYTSGVDSYACGGEEGLTPSNALHCAEPVGEDWIAMSDDLLYQGTYEIGDAFVYMVVAHEWGHAIQQRQPGWTAPWAELQADCLAGATLAEATDQGLLSWDEGDEAELAAGLEAAADETGWTDTTSHGSAEERTAFFQHGIDNGVEGCLYDGMEP
ncbi:neutral zinc metallopeptidase [Quadrisphaera sp. KR29]|uniref:neutral zinc metallopeptidase n=1 Tax=Quadrisphaera sp. KR29 TaxID=3461391 RepID=UPI00404518E8